MTRVPIRVSAGLWLPLDAVTQTFGIFGQRETGKSNTGAVLVEQVVRAGARSAVLDPTGVHWGLTRAGTGSGLRGVILGGEHGDAPLDPRAGAIVADFVIRSDYPLVVIDLKLLRKHQRQHFAMEFLERLYHDNRDPLLVVMDEAAQFAPMQMREGGDVPRLLGAVEDLVKLGRSRGLGAVMIEQRIATLNANVREQIGTLVAHRLIGPLDRKALRDWVAAQGEPEREKEALDQIAKLPAGEALVWSPAWLRFFDVVKVDPSSTFDSRATPRVGQQRRQPTRRTPVDLDALRERMAEVIDEAEANDPKRLRAKLTEAESKLTAALRHIASLPNDEELLAMRQEIQTLRAQLEARPPETVEVPAVTQDAMAQLAHLVETVEQGQEALLAGYAALREVTFPLAANVREALQESFRREVTVRQQKELSVPREPSHLPSPRVAPVGSLDVAAARQNGLTRKAERSVLTVLAQVPEGRSMRQLAILTGYAMNGGGFRNALGTLRRLGYIDGEATRYVITPTGRAAIGEVDDLPAEGEELLSHWLGQLKRKAEREVLSTLARNGGDPLSVSEIAEMTGYEATGGGFRNALGKLRTLQLIEGDKGVYRCHPSLVPLGSYRR